ncbi:hypothetical protein HII31_04295 [Pseudocercospora fuligena]|uniref:Uncharacterized protein n=1 Tax=Pseudocercospora fuligena TaxID=685502 RepID=A0A8H6VL05_9PEZI|nr:hypothetical protein HII31_04295 [Pseudocercospora fuligena]
MEARVLKHAREEWKNNLEMGMTREPFESWAQVNAPYLQSARQVGAVEREMYEQEIYRRMGPDAAQYLRDHKPGGSDSDRDRNDQKFRDIENRISGEYPHGKKQTMEMQDFIKDQVGRVTDESKEDHGGEQGDWTKLDKLYQRMIREPDERKEFNDRKRKEGAEDEDLMKEEDLSEKELQECVPLLWKLVP